MQEATPDTVSGDFSGVEHAYYGVVSTFIRRDGDFFVRTDGPDGELADYRIAYTFGIEPLQQYLIEFPDGRLQALSVCWDTRPEQLGGQRWFHLYPKKQVGHDDPLHWTGLQQNWNFMCAECHSTHLQKNYDASADRYTTTWSEIDVSCEARHGPGSRHVAWAETAGSDEPEASTGNLGFAVTLKDSDNGFWAIDPGTGVASRSVPRTLLDRARDLRDVGELESALTYARLLGDLAPRDVQVQALIREL